MWGRRLLKMGTKSQCKDADQQTCSGTARSAVQLKHSEQVRGQKGPKAERKHNPRPMSQCYWTLALLCREPGRAEGLHREAALGMLEPMKMARLEA